MKRVLLLGFSLALLSIAACGDDSSPIGATDSGIADAAVDASVSIDAVVLPPDATTGNVGLTVYSSNNAGPVAGANVIFLSPTGAMISQVVTDQNGQANASVPAGSSVTANNDTTDVFTFLDVKPGDQLVIGSPRQNNTTITATVTFPSDTTSQSYEVVSTCGNSVPLVTPPVLSTALSLDANCTLADFLVIGNDASSAPSDALFVKGVAVSANATIDLTGSYFGIVNTNFSASNLPPNSGLVVNAGMADGSNVILGYGNRGATVTNNSGSAPIALFDIPSLTEVWAIDAFFGTSRISVGGRNADRSDAVVDFSSINIPVLTNPNDSATVTGATVAWFETGTATADATYMDLQIQSTSVFEWHVAGPHIAGTLTLPTFPSGPFAAYNLDQNTAGRVDNLYVIQATGGWDALRPGIFSVRPDQPATYVQNVGDIVTMSAYYNDNCILGRSKSHRHGAIHPCH